MATIHITRGTTNLGTFSEEEVREGLRSGRFTASDLGWREGMPTWEPLSRWTEFATSAPPPAGGSTTTPGPIVPGPAVSIARSGLPWENRATRGFFPAFFETMVMVLTKPVEAFTAMKRESGFGEPLIYGLIGGSFGYIVYLLFMLLMPSMALFGNRKDAFAGAVGVGVGVVLAIIFIPICITLGLFIWAGILHVCLMIVGGAKHTFETTFRVVCFSLGSTYPLVIVPFCGGLIASIWGIVAQCIGIARAHETDTGRAVLAVFLPLIVCCGGGFLIAMMFGMLGALSHHGN